MTANGPIRPVKRIYENHLTQLNRDQYMDPTKLKDWIEVVGIFALVASLVFVGMQMKQTQDIAIAEQYQARAIYGADHVSAFAENETLLGALVKDIEIAYESSPEALCDNEGIKNKYLGVA